MNKLVDIIREDKEVALDELLLACWRSAHHYAHSAELADQAGHERQHFEAFLHRRKDMCERIEAIVRTRGSLPIRPDPDRQLLADLAVQTRTMLSADQYKPLLTKAARLEDKMSARLDAVLELDWSAGTKARLRSLRRDLRAERQRLDDLLDGHSQKGDIP